MKLSILICTLPRRREKFLFRLLDLLLPQIKDYDVKNIDYGIYSLKWFYNDDVEVIVCCDEKKLRVGAKRNLLLGTAVGEYVSFVDDDDRVSSDYVGSLLAGIEQDNDVVLFDVECSVNGGKPKRVIYDANYIADRNLHDSYLRIPNHIMCWKKEKIIFKFPKINFGEDVAWAKKMKGEIKSQSRIDKTLYFYDFSNQTSETQ